jgi:beta-lactam-binding protein with PASTA domain
MVPPCRAIALGCGLIVALALVAPQQRVVAQIRGMTVAEAPLNFTAPLRKPGPVIPMAQPRPAPLLPSPIPAPVIQSQPVELPQAAAPAQPPAVPRSNEPSPNPAPGIRPQPSGPPQAGAPAQAPSGPPVGILRGERPSEVARTFRVPSIIGDSPAQAEQVIASARLVFRQAGAFYRAPVAIDCHKPVSARPSPDRETSGERAFALSSPDARVSHQSPAAGEEVLAGTTVEAWFELPSPMLVAVPSIIGDFPGQAEQAVAGAHLTLRPAAEISSGNAHVSRQCPAPGARVQAGTVVEAWFEAAPAPLILVPSIIGDSPAQAGQAIAGAHLVLKQGIGATSATARVSRQSPSADSRVQAGSEVDAWFEVIVPSIVGDVPERATEVIKGANLTLQQNGGSQSDGRVSRQSPSAGEWVGVGSSVTAWFAASPPSVTVPSIVGDSPADAGQAIAGAHLALREPTGASAATARVSSQSPSAGSRVQAGSDVDAWFEVLVPSIVGDIQEQAREVIKGANLTLQQNGPSQPDGRVSRQSPSAGEWVGVGSSVTAWFAASPPSVTVPSIVGDSPAEAGQAIAGAHLALRQPTEAPSATARVSRQSPSAGTQVKAGSDVEAWFEVTVPSIVGDNTALAKEATVGAGLNLQSAGQGNSASARVTRQSPTAGERVAVGTMVTAWFAAPASPIVGGTAPLKQPTAPINGSPTSEGSANGSATQPSITPPDEGTASALPPDRPQSPGSPQSPDSLRSPNSPQSQAAGPSGPIHQPKPPVAAAKPPPVTQGEPRSPNSPDAADQSVIDPSSPPVIDGRAAESLALAPAGTISLLTISSIALTLAFAALGYTVHHRQPGRRSRPLTKWNVVARSDPGRQSIDFVDNPAGPVLGLRIVRADGAVQVSWASEETLHA